MNWQHIFIETYVITLIIICLCIFLADANGIDEVVGIACSVYYNLIKVLPAVVRSWYTDLEKRANVLLDK